jgi:SWIM zinc finger
VTVTISADDPRTIRAIEIAAEADYWLTGHSRDGEEVFGVPSQRDPGRYYIVTKSRCDCADFKQRGDGACKHILAVRLHTELAMAQQQQASRSSRQRSRGHLTVLS